MSKRELHPRLMVFLRRLQATVHRHERHKLRCTRPQGGETISFRVEILKKRTATRTNVTGSIEMGCDSGTWARICSGSSVLAVYVEDVDAWAVAIPGELQTRTHHGSGGGYLATDGGAMVYWALKSMRTINAEGRLVPWDDLAARAERRAVSSARAADDVDIVEHEGHAPHHQPTILELLGS